MWSHNENLSFCKMMLMYLPMKRGMIYKKEAITLKMIASVCLLYVYTLLFQYLCHRHGGDQAVWSNGGLDIEAGVHV